MKVGVLTGEVFAFGSYGGFGYVARNTANILRDFGYDVCIIDVDRFGTNSDMLDDIPVHFLMNKKVRLGPIEELRFTKKFVKRVPVDAILAISEFACGKWVYYYKIASPQTKSLIWFQDLRTDEDWKRIFSVPLCRTNDEALPLQILHEKYRRFLRKKGVKKSDGLITQSKLLDPKIKKIYGVENVGLVPNPIPIPPGDSISKQATPLVVFLGRLDPIKRPWIYGEIARNLPNMQFLILGTSHYPEIMNPLMEEYKKLENLNFLGLTVGKEKAEILSRAWILVNTSIYEALPVSFLEALSYKMAILSCQNPDAITSGYGVYTGQPLGNGYHEVPRFVKGLQYLLSNSRWKEMGERGYKFVKPFASIRKTAERLDLILRSL